MDAEPGLLELFARFESNWVEGWGRMFWVLTPHTCGGDGKVKAVRSNFAWACWQLQFLSFALVPFTNLVFLEWRSDPMTSRIQKFDQDYQYVSSISIVSPFYLCFDW